MLIWILGFMTLGTKADFNVYWNAPSSSCSKNFGINVTKDLLNNKVLVNNGERSIGDRIVIFYGMRFGKYPYIDTKNGSDINGGIPQLANLSEHLELARSDIEKMIPNLNFDGIGIIDWEKWRPIYNYNWGGMTIYKTRTMELVRKQNPCLPEQLVESTAEMQWEETAKQWMLKTLNLAKNMRPKARWCYYLFPDCYNYHGNDEPLQFFCNKTVQEYNDRLSWLWEASTAICPSIYFNNRQEKYNDQQRLWYLYGRLSEALRVSSPSKLIYPYVTYKNTKTRTDVPKEHFWRMLSLSASMGLDGIVIWGSSNYVKKKEDCEALASYVKNVIGPSVSTVSSNFNRCSKSICRGLGRCVWPDEPHTSWRYMGDNDSPYFVPENIVCRCHRNEGRYCNLSNFICQRL
uniref:Hyaluronidase n=1 Tax=Megacormus gertschi TaxID=1843536 RepID=A0A224XBJ0_9SCOR